MFFFTIFQGCHLVWSALPPNANQSKALYAIDNISLSVSLLCCLCVRVYSALFSRPWKQWHHRQIGPETINRSLCGTKSPGEGGFSKLTLFTHKCREPSSCLLHWVTLRCSTVWNWAGRRTLAGQCTKGLLGALDVLLMLMISEGEWACWPIETGVYRWSEDTRKLMRLSHPLLHCEANAPWGRNTLLCGSEKRHPLCQLIKAESDARYRFSM